jgi:CelD/BcsL family acetyltransferase involved in cellulose biosynthesis
MKPEFDTRPGAAALRMEFAPPSALPDDAVWYDLVKGASEANPFLEPWFLRPALAHLTEGRTVRIALLWAGEKLVGLMPLIVRDRYGRMPVRHVGNWAHYQSFAGAPLVVAGLERSFWDALLVALDGADWAPNFSSFSDLDPTGPVFAALQSCERETPIVHRRERAMLASKADAETYLATNVRPKKRKEWRRLSHRIAEMGTVTHSTLTSGDDLTAWCAAFVALEASGWKGERGAAMGNTPATQSFFDVMMHGAWDAGRLEFQRIDLNDAPIAMLINFRTPPGSWSFKIAHDGALARFSPGVMIELENLARVLDDPAIDWMDSCAVENHPMIDSLWAERRQMVQVSVPLAGLKRRIAWTACRTAETASARLRQWRNR